MYPRFESLILRGLTIIAIDMAAEGEPGDGYTSLVLGLSRIRDFQDAGVPGSEELMGSYRRTLDQYAELYRIARE